MPEDYALDAVEVWPENWQAFGLLADMRTQWRVAMGGPIGLDYVALFGLMDLNDIPTTERRMLLDDLQVMEAAAMSQMAVKYT